MATLTADEIEYIRAMSGDDCVPYEVSPPLLQKFFDKNSGDDCGTIVFVLRVRVQKAAKLVSQSNESGQSQSLSDLHTHLTQDLALWEERCGMSGAVLVMGTFDLHLDTDDDDEEDSF